ncbi:MAG TPA: hypothetical protein VFL55_12990, partial [Acetobacteraceae bacterium]|nr:hypothetical protein [Acetobacteraceae bacterium]
MKSVGLISLAAVAVLSACSTAKPTQSTCVVAHESSFLSTGHAEQQITVAKNGARCVIAMSIGRAGMGEATVSVPPEHGTPEIRAMEEATLIAYTPAPNYVGPDHFDVAFGPNFTVSVLVQVV